ncbi:MAG: DUF4080 domain-containing protein [Bacillota bacterium]
MHPLFVSVNAKYIHTNNAVRLLSANSAHETEFLDFTIKDAEDKIIDTLLDKNPSVIGFSTYIWNVEIISALVIALKERSNIPIILGGPEVSYDAHHFLSTLPVEVIVKGEGEHVIDDVLDYLLKGTTLENTPNVAWKNNETIIEHPIEEIEDLSIIQSPHHFEEDLSHIPKRIQYVESSRGCPFKCSYCLSSLEKKVRFFPLQDVLDTLSHLLEKGAKTIKFLDRTFNANKDALAIIDFLIANHKEGTVFQFEITGEIMDEAIIDHIHAHAPRHLFRFEIGIQSTNDITNRLVGRIQNNDKLFRLIEKIKEADIIDMHLDLIAGLPLETLERFKKTFNDVYALGSRELQLGFLKFLRGTKIRNEAELYEYRFKDEAPYEIESNTSLSKEDLAYISRVEEGLDLFHNKGYFEDTLFPILKHHFDDYFTLFYDMMTTYLQSGYKRKGYQLDEVYGFTHDYLKNSGVDETSLDTLKITYLRRSKVKPKTYFETIKDKSIKRPLFEKLDRTSYFDISDYYKHALVAEIQKGYVVALYKNQTSHIETIEKTD